MRNRNELDEVIENLKRLVILYGEVADELIVNLEKSNQILAEANNKIDILTSENEKLAEKNNALEKKNTEKLEELAKLKQKRIPSVDEISDLMNKLQDMLMKTTNISKSQDSDDCENDEKMCKDTGKIEHPATLDLKLEKLVD